MPSFISFRLSADQGTVFVEYVVLLTLVSIGVVLALVALGVPLLNLFLFQQAEVMLPIP